MIDVTHVPDLDAAPHAEVFADGDGAPRSMRLALDAGERVPEHSHPESNVFLYVASGDLELSLDGETRTLAAGDAVRFEGERRVSPRAVTDAAALVVFAPA